MLTYINRLMAALGLLAMAAFSNAQESAVLDQSQIVDAQEDTKYYRLHYKKSSHELFIEKPPTSMATSTPIFLGDSISPLPEREIDGIDEDFFTRRVSHDVRARVVEHTCDIETLINRASFTICNDEDQTIVINAEDQLRHAKIDEAKSILTINPGRCEALSIYGDDSDLQFDCSGIFGVVFKVRLESDNRERYLSTVIRSSKRLSE